MFEGLVFGLAFGLVLGPVFALVLGLFWALGWGRGVGLVVLGRYLGLFFALGVGLVLALVFGLDLALRNGGWFVVLQKVAHRRLARAGNLPSPPYDFLEWGIDRQIFRRVGGGVRFRHNLIQQHLASTSEGVS